jgi:hypothetical protein
MFEHSGLFHKHDVEGSAMRPETRDHARSALDRGIPGALPRIVCLVTAVFILGLGLLTASDAVGAASASVGFGFIAVAAALHAMALRWPHRYALNGSAWVATVVTLFGIVTIVIGAGH